MKFNAEPFLNNVIYFHSDINEGRTCFVNFKPVYVNLNKYLVQI